MVATDRQTSACRVQLVRGPHTIWVCIHASSYSGRPNEARIPLMGAADTAKRINFARRRRLANVRSSPAAFGRARKRQASCNQRT